VTVLAGGLMLTFMLLYAADLAWWATVPCCLFNLLGAGIVWFAAGALMLRFGRDERRSRRSAAVVAVGYYVVTTIALLVRGS
jgi:hypothetical protein